VDTNLQVTNKVQMHFLDEHGSVRLYNLRSVLQAWIDHRVRVIVRRSENRLERRSTTGCTGCRASWPC
jgi:DNA gyrase subunit A